MYASAWADGRSVEQILINCDQIKVTRFNMQMHRSPRTPTTDHKSKHAGTALRLRAARTPLPLHNLTPKRVAAPYT